MTDTNRDLQAASEVITALDALVKRIPEVAFRLGAGDMTPAGVVRWAHDMLPPLPQVRDTRDEPGDEFAAWLNRQIDIDEQAEIPHLRDCPGLTLVPTGTVVTPEDDPYACTCGTVARWIADIRTKRGLIDLHVPESGQHPDFCGHDLRELPCPTLRLVALRYEGCDGYRDEWRPRS